jgi:phenylacetate-CoA ligase
MSEYYDNLETRSADERAQAQFESIRAQIGHVKTNTTAYAESLRDFEGADITDAAAFSALPLTRKSGLIELQQANRPFGGYTPGNSARYSHVFASPGPIYEPGYAVPDFWRFARSLYASGFRAGDLVHNCFSYHFTPAGQMFDSAAAALGCAVIPAGVGQTELQVQTIADLKPDGYVGTPSFLKIILEQADELGADVSSITKAMMSGEALPPPLHAGFVERGVRVQQCYGTADLGLIAYESSAREGLIIDEGVYLEIVRPGTGELVEPGEVGEVVVTNLGREADPFRHRRSFGLHGRYQPLWPHQPAYQGLDGSCRSDRQGTRHVHPPGTGRSSGQTAWRDRQGAAGHRLDRSGGPDHAALRVQQQRPGTSRRDRREHPFDLQTARRSRNRCARRFAQ